MWMCRESLLQWACVALLAILLGQRILQLRLLDNDNCVLTGVDAMIRICSKYNLCAVFTVRGVKWLSALLDLVAVST